jgi:peptide/nickel transport system substrate-binding protein
VRQRGDSLDPFPDLAQKWRISPDGKTYTFYLVKNAVWHDGQPFTSADVKFSIEEVLLKHHPAGKLLFGAIDRVETPDPYTAILELKYAYAPLMTWLMFKNFSTIIPKHIYEGTDIKKNPYNFQPIGTGPFKFKEYVKGSHVRVVRNENYFRKGQPYLDEIIIRIIPDWTSMLTAFETGEVNYMSWGIPRHSLARLAKLPHVKVDLKTAVENGALWTRFNLRHAALGKLKVRQAMAYATDKKEILKKAFYGQGIIAESFINPDNPFTSWAYDPGIPVYEYNPDKANKLLDEAGFPRKSNGMRFSIRQYTSASDVEAGKTNEILREQWRKVGIELKVMPLEGTAFPQLVYKKWDFDLAMGFWPFGPDPSLLGLHIHSRQIRPGLVPGNIMGYRNESVDGLLDKAAAASDLKERAKMYGEISSIIAEDVPVMWFIFDKRAYVYHDRFVGLSTPAFGTIDSYDGIWSKKGK